MALRVVSAEEILKKFQKGESLDNFQVILAWENIKGYRMRAVTECSLGDVLKGVIVELF